MGTDDELHQSNPNSTGPERAAGDMGVSSERTGETGAGEHATDGTKDTSEMSPAADADVPPEQRPGQVETNPEGLTPKAGYSRTDPRSS